MPEPQRYYAYMLRGWLENEPGEKRRVWRFRLRNVQTGEQMAFATLEEVSAYLKQIFERDKEDRALPGK